MSETASSGAARRAILLLLGLITVTLLGAEIGTRTIVVPLSRVERRTTEELRDAVAPNPTHGRTILLVGNSLLLAAIDKDAMTKALAPGWRFRRLVVEQTYFLDWLYGLEELERRGARPDVIAVMLDAGQLAGKSTRGDYSAFRLIGWRDILRLGRDADFHPTDISRLVLSHWSAYYGFRGESRKVLMLRLIPGLERVLALAAPRGQGGYNPATLRAEATAHLRALKDVADRHGSRLVFVLPPVLDADRSNREIRAAAADAGVPLVAPFDEADYSADDFVDGYHLDEQGAARYTRQLSDALRRGLGGHF